MLNKLHECFKVALGVSNINDKSTMQNTKAWDSTSQLALIIEIENAFNISFEDRELMEMVSVEKILEIIKLKGGKE